MSKGGSIKRNEWKLSRKATGQVIDILTFALALRGAGDAFQ
jgi:hypothetical protein